MSGKKNKVSNLMVVILTLSATGLCYCAEVQKNYFPSFADEHTVGLWLFDEADYPYTTLTDAGKYEYDLRLMKGGRLVRGKYGNCLKLTPGRDYAVSYAAWKGAVGFNKMREVSGRPGSGLFGPTIAPKQLLETLAERDFTCEFWLMLMSNPIQDVTLIDLGNKLEAGFTITLKRKAKGFIIEDSYAGFKAVCPTLLEQIWGRSWHHIGFTYSAGSKKLFYFIDGKAQEAITVTTIARTKIPASVRPESISDTTYGIFEKEDRTSVPDYEKRMRHRFNFAIGHNRQGENDFNGNIDELRFSDVVRYRGNFSLPDSFSRNYGKNASKPSVANGPALLFESGNHYLPREPVRLGSRKHVFIDEVMVAKKSNVQLTLNRPANPVKLNINAAWDASFFEYEGKIYSVKSEGYEGDEGPILLYVSQDGVHFDSPKLGLIEHNGSKENNLVMLGLPSWGKYFKDTNPACPPEERFKATLWVAQRGIYLYFSPDAVHWRRNETCMLPLVSGGGCETFWDDQQGMYFNYIKRDGSYSTGDYPNYGRSVTMFKTREVNKAWPFRKLANPYYEGWPFPAVTGEGVTVMGPDLTDPDFGQIFRTRPQKYRWAPDVYVGFLVRNGQSDMAVSRDGLHWKICSDEGKGYYVTKGRQFDSNEVKNGVVANGMIRRGDKLWQYVNGRISGSKGGGTYRVEQRLDGFMSLEAGDKTGVVITRPLIFAGDKLTLNVSSKGWVKVAILSQTGREINGYNTALTIRLKKTVSGFGLNDCDPIRTDSVRQIVTWKGSSDVGSLAGSVVRLRFDMQNAKIYAFKFE